MPTALRLEVTLVSWKAVSASAVWPKFGKAMF